MTSPEPVPSSTPPADQLPPGLSPNGHPTPTAQLVQQLPQMLFQAVAAALQQVRVTLQEPVTVRPLPCSACFLERLKWGHAHAAEFAEAEKAYAAAAAEMAQRSPEDQVPLNGIEYLPEHMRPGGTQAAPGIQDGAVMIGGTLYCAGHIPGAPGQPGQSPLLIAQGALPDGTLAGFLRGLAA